MSLLPPEIRHLISQNLPVRDLLRLCSTSREWRSLCQGDLVWKEIIKRKKGYLPSLTSTSYKQYALDLSLLEEKDVYLAVDVDLPDPLLPQAYIDWYELLDDLMEGSNYSLQPLNEDESYLEGKQGGVSLLYKVKLSTPQTYSEMVKGIDALLENVETSPNVLSIYYYLV